MSDKKDKKFNYKEELINKIPEEFQPKEKPEIDPKNFSIQDILDEEPKVVSTSLSGPGQVLINNYIPEVKNKEDSIVYVIPRKELDYRILRKAINFGVEDFTGHKFDSMTKNINGWEVVISKDGIRKKFNT